MTPRPPSRAAPAAAAGGSGTDGAPASLLTMPLSWPVAVELAVVPTVMLDSSGWYLMPLIVNVVGWKFRTTVPDSVPAVIVARMSALDPLEDAGPGSDCATLSVNPPPMKLLNAPAEFRVSVKSPRLETTAPEPVSAVPAALPAKDKVAMLPKLMDVVPGVPKKPLVV